MQHLQIFHLGATLWTQHKVLVNFICAFQRNFYFLDTFEVSSPKTSSLSCSFPCCLIYIIFFSFPSSHTLQPSLSKYKFKPRKYIYSKDKAGMDLDLARHHCCVFHRKAVISEFGIQHWNRREGKKIVKCFFFRLVCARFGSLSVCWCAVRASLIELYGNWKCVYYTVFFWTSGVKKGEQRRGEKQHCHAQCSLSFAISRSQLYGISRAPAEVQLE